jgi:MFS family permease
LSYSRWWRLIPLIFVTYSLAYLDRANFGLAAAAGMAGDLHITSGMSALLGAVFFLGYVLFQVPGVLYAQRHGVRHLIGGCLLLWGLCSALPGVVSDFRVLLLLRFGLGVAEAAVFPALILYITRWFTRGERAQANSLLILGNPATVLWMSVVSAYLISALNWRWMFLLEGLVTILWAAVWWRLACERPAEAPWLPAQAAKDLAAELEREQAGRSGTASFAAAIRSPLVLLIAAQFFGWTLGVFGFVLWLPSILRAGSSMGMVKTGWCSAAPYLAAIIIMPLVSRRSDRAGRRKRFIWPFLLLGAVAFYGSYLAGGAHFWVSFGLLVVAGAAMYAPYGPFWALVSELLPPPLAAPGIALINGAGAIGGFFGSYLVGWLNGATGGPGASFLTMAGALALSVVITLLLPTPVPASSPAS